MITYVRLGTSTTIASGNDLGPKTYFDENGDNREAQDFRAFVKAGGIVGVIDDVKPTKGDKVSVINATQSVADLVLLLVSLNIIRAMDLPPSLAAFLKAVDDIQKE